MTIKNVLVAGLTVRGVKPVCVLESNYRVHDGASAVREFLSCPEIPTVMFCGNDLIAMGAMSALKEAGVRVPEDVSVLGIDDISFAYLGPSSAYNHQGSARTNWPSRHLRPWIES